MYVFQSEINTTQKIGQGRQSIRGFNLIIAQEPKVVTSREVGLMP